jgi:predicted nucleic acid-binding protein
MSQPLDHTITAYFDSSALVKRYLVEAGTAWVQAWCDSPTQTVAVAEIALVEIAAAFAAKLRGEFISQEAYYDARADLAADSRDEYILVAVSRAVVDEAVELTARHRLRGYDAVHLACALHLNRALVVHRLSPLVFVSADSDLLAAAATEKLPTDNPNNYP